MKKRILAVIPARGSSKSIPRKNIKLLAGKPMVAYTIEAAKGCREIDRIVVSTEDKEIARVAKEWGAEVPFLRPQALAEDQVQDLPVFQHCLQWLHEKDGYLPDIVLQLRPTSPLRTARHIQAAIQLFLEDDTVDCVRGVSPAGIHPLKMWRIEDKNLVPFIPETVYDIPEAYNYPRQKLPKAYIQNGAIEVIRTSTIMEKNSMSGKKIRAFVMSEEESINIDGVLDFTLAELLMEKNEKERRLHEKS